MSKWTGTLSRCSQLGVNDSQQYTGIYHDTTRYTFICTPCTGSVLQVYIIDPLYNTSTHHLSYRCTIILVEQITLQGDHYSARWRAQTCILRPTSHEQFPLEPLTKNTIFKGRSLLCPLYSHDRNQNLIRLILGLDHLIPAGRLPWLLNFWKMRVFLVKVVNRSIYKGYENS